MVLRSRSHLKSTSGKADLAHGHSLLEYESAPGPAGGGVRGGGAGGARGAALRGGARAAGAGARRARALRRQLRRLLRLQRQGPAHGTALSPVAR